MKKLLTAILCLLIITGCSNKKTQNAGMANPITVCSSLQELNEKTHGNIVKPAIMGISDEKFNTIETGDGIIGEYRFTLNGSECYIRFSDTILNEDISGIWINGKEAFSNDKEQINAKGEGYQLKRHFTVDGQYVFAASDTIEEKNFETLAEELFLLVANKGNN